ncbi:MAG: hypothetical protein JXR60_04935 [Bacteroidales bacterium]|nr:hypothetical protein [Bacteroidales bacterium]
MIVLLAILFNIHGFVVEHHECNACYEGMCEIGDIDHQNSCCQEHSTCHLNEVKHHVCDLTSVEHQRNNHCQCYAEYFQSPVFSFDNETENQIIWVLFPLKLNSLLTIEYIDVKNSKLFLNHPKIEQAVQKRPFGLLFCTLIC